MGDVERRKRKSGAEGGREGGRESGNASSVTLQIHHPYAECATKYSK